MVVPLVSKFKATQARSIHHQRRFLQNLSTQPCSLFALPSRESKTIGAPPGERTEDRGPIYINDLIYSPSTDQWNTQQNADLAEDAAEALETQNDQEENSQNFESTPLVSSVAPSCSKPAATLDYYSVANYPRRLKPTPFARCAPKLNGADPQSRMAVKLYGSSNAAIKQNNFFFEKRYSRDICSPKQQ